jgi:hypothetical protein
MSAYLLYTRTEAGTIERKEHAMFSMLRYFSSGSTWGVPHGMAGIKGLGKEDRSEHWFGAL